MARQRISQYLFECIKASGVDCTFGIPGDYILPLYAAQEDCGLKTLVMTHEPAIGFAADAYARIKGLGVALVTYGAGGLNMINPTALAYAEESPLLVLSGGPEIKYRKEKAHLHHCVKTFATQDNVYAEVTAANATLEDAQEAKVIIDNILHTVKNISRPGYLELPRDLISAEIEINAQKQDNEVSHPFSSKQKAVVNAVMERLSSAKNAVILAGVQVSRFNLLPAVIAISEKYNLPVVTSILGKSAFPESHPNFIGNYFGQFGNPTVSEFIDQCDCIIGLGVVLTEMETGGYTARLPEEKLILINNEEIVVGKDHLCGPLGAPFLNSFMQTAFMQNQAEKKFFVPQIAAEETNNAINDLSVGHIIASLNRVIDENMSIVCDVGDCLYAGLSVKTDCFIAPGYYSSMGFGVPAGIGVQMADRKKRPIILVGDGGFQMTGMELSTAVKEGLNPIVIVFNNASYAMLKFIDQERKYYALPNWDYAALAQSIGATGFKAETSLQFDLALQKALKSNTATLIDAALSPEDISPTLKRLTDHFGRRMRAAAAR